MECVCPPHTSINTQGRVTAVLIASRSCATAAGSRYSSRYFTATFRFDVFDLSQFAQQREYAHGLRHIESRQREADVNEDVLADRDLGNVLQADALEYSAEIDLAHEQVAVAADLD